MCNNNSEINARPVTLRSVLAECADYSKAPVRPIIFCESDKKMFDKMIDRVMYKMKICDPIKEIKEAIPQLEGVSDYNNLIYLTHNQWANRVKTIESKNLKKYHRSKAWISLFDYFTPCIVCHHDNVTIEINKEKYKLIRQYLMSEEFNKRKDN